MHDYVTLLDALTQTHGSAVALRRAQAFMLDYLRRFQRPLPGVVADALAVAERNAHAEVPDQAAVATARRACWAFIEKQLGNSDFTHPTHNVVQAAICLLGLELRQAESLVEVVPWFVSLADSFEDHTRDHEALLKKHFAA